MRVWPVTILVVALGTVSVFGQEPKQTVRPKSPELKIAVIPGKQAYLIGEEVLTTTEFTNLTSETLCFPEPAQHCQDAVQGYSLSVGHSPDDQRDWFHCIRDGRGIPADKLASEIERRWVKIAPNAVFRTKPSLAIGSFDVVGEWKITTSYYPPAGSSGYRNSLQTGARSAGCTMPLVQTTAEPVTISVTAPASK